MAFFEFTTSAQQAAELKELKSVLSRARDLAGRINDQNTQMALAQKQTQFGIPAGLSEAAWDTTIGDIVTALDATAVTNFVNRVGFA
ncbi:MAG: hypothetical protein KC441_02430 [Anaerolineales bacterium]|nr:hypothetical protein [Anaerolineales bacterium]